MPPTCRSRLAPHQLGQDRRAHGRDRVGDPARLEQREDQLDARMAEHQQSTTPGAAPEMAVPPTHVTDGDGGAGIRRARSADLGGL